MKRKNAQRKRFRSLRMEQLETRKVLAAIISGQEIIGSIPVNGVDEFQFTATDGDAIRIAIGERNANSNTSGQDPILQLFGPDGVQITTGVSNTADQSSAELIATATGTYTAFVREEDNNQPLEYRIRVLTLPDTDPQEVIDRDFDLVNGQEVESSLPQGSFNVHQFTATDGDAIRIAIGERNANSNTSGQDPILQLFGPDGVQITTGVSNTADQSSAELIATATGTYTAFVREEDNNQPLEYRIRVLTLPDENPQELTDRDFDLANGQEVESSLPQGSFNVHQFTATDGDAIRIAIGERNANSNTSGQDPILQLFGPDGVQITTGVSNTADQSSAAHVATATGTYTAFVREEDNNQPLEYRIRVLTLPDADPQELTDRDFDLANGQEVESSLPQGSFNVHQFTATDGDAIRIAIGERNANSNTSGQDPILQLFGPDGVQITTGVSNTADQSNAAHVATATGIYTAFVREEDNNQPLEYRIRVLTLPDADPQELTDRDFDLANGQEVESSLPQGSFNVHQFTATDGDAIRIAVGERNANSNTSGQDPILQLFGPDGVQITTGVSNTTDQSSAAHVATATGIYTAFVREEDNNQPLEYRIRVLGLPDADPQELTDRDFDLANGQEVESSLPQGSFNVHQFTATDGDAIRIAVGERNANSNTSGQDPILQLFGPDGVQITTGVSNTADQSNAEHVATATGTYTAFVREENNNQPLEYRIRVLTLPDTDPQQLTDRDFDLANGQEVESSLPQGSFNVHQFTATDGDAIRIAIGERNANSNTSGQDPILQLFGPDGVQITTGVSNTTDQSSAEHVATATGTYTAFVREEDNNQPLEYRIVVNGISDINLATVNIASTNENVAEDVGMLTIKVNLSAAVNGEVSVPFTVAGTATKGGDFSITASPLTIPAGQTSATVTITVIDDVIVEGDETVIVTLGMPTGAELGTPTVHTATITDNDVTVVDTSAPVITVPDDITVEGDDLDGSSDSNSVIAAFLAGATATDNVDPSVTVTHNAPEHFPIGNTVVIFSATDQAGNVATASATVTVEPPTMFDFGDAPSTFPVTLSQDGARHATGGLFFGASIDEELDGNATADASGDGNDEDGVTARASLIAAPTSNTVSSFAIVASAAGKLDAWIDFNRDGDWDDDGEQVFASKDVTPGVNTLSYIIPADANPGDVAARFRLSTAGGLTPSGIAADGEVEDYIANLEAAGNNTVNLTSINATTVTIEQDGSDVVVREGSLILFQGPADQLAGLNFTGSNGNDTIDLIATVTSFSSLVRLHFGDGTDTLRISGQDQSLDLTTLPTGSVEGLEVIDVSGNGSIVLRLNEAHVASLPDRGRRLRVIMEPDDILNISVNTTINVENVFTIRDTLIDGDQFIALAQSDNATIEVAGLRWTNPLNRLDVNNSGKVSALDALDIINELNRRRFVISGTSRLIDPTQMQGAHPLQFFDTTANGELTALDALRVINGLARIVGSTSLSGEMIPVLSELQGPRVTADDVRDRSDPALETNPSLSTTIADPARDFVSDPGGDQVPLLESEHNEVPTNEVSRDDTIDFAILELLSEQSPLSQSL